MNWSGYRKDLTDACGEMAVPWDVLTNIATRAAQIAMANNAKAAIPSGQVAEDAALVLSIMGRYEPVSCRTRHRAALERLAARAQSTATYRANWQEAERGRMELLAEREGWWKERSELERQRDARERDLMVHFEAKNAALKRVAELEARCARLSAAGQVLSEHVDKAPELTLRDEFAMVAMHIVVTVCKAEIDDGSLLFRDIARRAYGMADELLRAREAT
jgi:hypothetical protein